MNRLNFRFQLFHAIYFRHLFEEENLKLYHSDNSDGKLTGRKEDVKYRFLFYHYIQRWQHSDVFSMYAVWFSVVMHSQRLINRRAKFIELIHFFFFEEPLIIAWVMRINSIIQIWDLNNRNHCFFGNSIEIPIEFSPNVIAIKQWYQLFKFQFQKWIWFP